MSFPLQRGIVRMACALVCAVATQAASAQAISLAETLLFQTNHLHNVGAPLTLTYAFHKTGSLEPGFDDQVEVILADGKPGALPDGASESKPGGKPDLKPSVTMQFLSGARQRKTPDAENAEGNPALLGFLERDIAEMQRLTGGSGNYFRKRIRLALADGAQVRPARFTYAGKALDGREVSIEPYRNDPLAKRFERYVPKRYTFVVSAQVPGGVYRMGSMLAGPAGGAPLMEETLTLVSAANQKR